MGTPASRARNDPRGFSRSRPPRNRLPTRRPSASRNGFSCAGCDKDRQRLRHNRSVETDVLRDWFDHRVETHEFSGVALVWGNGAPQFRYAGGTAHRGHQVPIANDTRSGVASVTKMVTAAAALRLVDRGLLRLDQPVIEILPP